MLLPRQLTASVSGLKRSPLHTSHGSFTSGRKLMAMVEHRSSVHSSHAAKAVQAAARAASAEVYVYVLRGKVSTSIACRLWVA